MIKCIDELVDRYLEQDWIPKIKKHIEDQLNGIFEKFAGGLWIKFEVVNNKIQ